MLRNQKLLKLTFGKLICSQEPNILLCKQVFVFGFLFNGKWMYISQSFCDYVLKNDIVWQMNYPLIVCIAVAVSKIVGYTKIRFKIKISWKQNLDQSNFSQYFFYKKQKVKTLIWFLCFPFLVLY